jgi:F-type H+-transporting ATPase subunit b
MATSSDHGQVEGTLAHGGQPHGKSPFPPFDPANFTPLLIWLVLTFGLLYLLMSKIALPRVANILHTRSTKISGDIAEAHGLHAQSEEAAAALEKTLAEARAKAQALAQETHARLNAETEAKRQVLEANLNGQLGSAEAHIAEMKKQAMSNVGTIAGEAAAAIVARITGRPADTRAIAAALAADKG